MMSKDKKKIWINLISTVVGAVLFYVGGFVLDSEVQSIKMISGLCIGLGAATFCLGIGGLISMLLISKSKTEEIEHRKNIEVNDERNVHIREKAGAKFNHIMVYVLTAFVLTLGFMNAEKLIIIMASALLLIQLILAIFLSDYYAKRM